MIPMTQKPPRPTNKQHFVPQLYLKQFANEKGQLIAYDKADGAIRKVGVRDAAQKRGFLSVPEFDKDDGSGSYAETYLHQYEDPTATVIERVLGGLRSGIIRLVDDDARRTLSLFMAVQYQRTQVARARMDDINVALAVMADQWPGVPQLQGLSPAPQGPDMARYHLASGLSPKRIDGIADVLHGHYWGLFINRTDLPLYTSDSPLALFCHAQREDEGYGLATWGVEISLPLAPHCLLVLK